MGFWTDLFNGGRNFDSMSEARMYLNMAATLDMQRAHWDSEESKARAHAALDPLRMHAMKNTDIERKNRLEKLRNPKSIYLKKRRQPKLESCLNEDN